MEDTEVAEVVEEVEAKEGKEAREVMAKEGRRTTTICSIEMIRWKIT